MPIVEYYSPDTHTIYQFYARNLADAGRMPHCPGGEHLRMERIPSTFAVTGLAKEPSDTGGDEDAYSAEQQAAMMRLSAQMEGLSDENPDPRQLGRMMREMSLIAGKGKTPEQLDEVIRRLEAGENVDHLEDQIESVMGDAEDRTSDFETTSDAGRQKIRRMIPARRDPKLHELRDYL